MPQTTGLWLLRIHANSKAAPFRLTITPHPGNNQRTVPRTSFSIVSMGFPAGHYLDPQPLASGNVFQRQAYGNYTFGVYMAGAGVSLNTALFGANTYAFFFSSYPESTPMYPKYGSLPAASVTNITNGYNAYVNETVCHK